MKWRKTVEAVGRCTAPLTPCLSKVLTEVGCVAAKPAKAFAKTAQIGYKCTVVTVTELRQMQTRVPFRPLDVHLTSGEVLSVKHPDTISIPAPDNGQDPNLWSGPFTDGTWWKANKWQASASMCISQLTQFSDRKPVWITSSAYYA